MTCFADDMMEAGFQVTAADRLHVVALKSMQIRNLS